MENILLEKIMKEVVISKEDFKQYFNNKKMISKNEYIQYCLNRRKN